MTSFRDAAPAGPTAPASPTPTAAGVRRVPLGLESVRYSPDSLLGRWQSRSAEATIPHCIERLEASGVLNNLRRVVGESGAPYEGFVFADSDLYKVIEAVAWEIARTGTARFDAWLDEVIGLVERVQERSGYCHSWIQGVDPGKRFAELDWTHEMYVLGHMIQAAVALDRAVGRRDLLEVAERFAALVDRRFGPGREDGIPGHPELETALVELHRHTGQERWLRLAEHVVDQRGHDILPNEGFGHRYYQDHVPVREAVDPTGHAVRQLYLNAGVTDLYLERGEQSLHAVILAQWERAHECKMYLSGAFGSRHRDESFGNDFEPPSDRAYAETCATIADLQWTWRMALTGEDPRYDDVVEREILNALAASTDATGTRFFYSNPMQRRPDRFSEESAPAERQAWYPCACCPPNIARAVAQAAAYTATVRDGRVLEIHQLFAARIELPSAVGRGALVIRSDYPASGEIRLELDGALDERAQVALRVPGWAAGASLELRGSGRAVTDEELAAGRVLLGPEEADGAVLSLPMTPRWTVASHRVDAVRGCVALERGPVLYCLEQVDLPEGVAVDDLWLPEEPVVEEAGLHDGEPAPRLRLAARVRAAADRLYGPAAWGAERDAGRPVEVELVPFSTWGNRGPGAMRVWIPTC